jgi:hypothetical protein
MNKATIVAWACRLSVAVALGHLCGQSSVAGEIQLDLGGDFTWTIGEFRSEVSVKREIPACIGFTNGRDVDFTSEDKPFTVVTVTLKAKKPGTFDLIPELFLMRDDLQYRVCHGVRVLEPEPDLRTVAFHPPNGASVWPGHCGDRISCKEGDSVVIELLFDHVWKRDQAELLVASRPARSPESELQRLHTEMSDVPMTPIKG